MEHGKREPEQNRTPHRVPRERKSVQKGTGHKVAFVIGTVMLIGFCTAVMIASIFMIYVKTTLKPVLQVDANDYTMNQSSIIYYHDETVTENDGWVELQTVHGEENRIWVDYDQMPDAL